MFTPRGPMDAGATGTRGTCQHRVPRRTGRVAEAQPGSAAGRARAGPTAEACTTAEARTASGTGTGRPAPPPAKRAAPPAPPPNPVVVVLGSGADRSASSTRSPRARPDVTWVKSWPIVPTVTRVGTSEPPETLYTMAVDPFWWIADVGTASTSVAVDTATEACAGAPFSRCAAASWRVTLTA